jgi:hypothetical protein
VYAGPLKLNSPDPVQHRRLVQIYLGDLATVIEDAAPLRPAAQED